MPGLQVGLGLQKRIFGDMEFTSEMCFLSTSHVNELSAWTSSCTLPHPFLYFNWVLRKWRRYRNKLGNKMWGIHFPLYRSLYAGVNHSVCSERVQSCCEQRYWQICIVVISCLDNKRSIQRVGIHVQIYLFLLIYFVMPEGSDVKAHNTIALQIQREMRNRAVKTYQ